MNMSEPTIESIFGANAGAVWRALHKNGPGNISDIARATSLSREEVHGALGWLGRENKIVMERRARVLFFSLQESEMGESAPHHITSEEKSPDSSGAGPKRTSKASVSRATSSTLEAARKALAFILAELEENREPTMAEVSKAAGMHSRQLGKALSSLDVKSRAIRIKGKSVQIYPLDLKARVWELAALDADGLQKMMMAGEQAPGADTEQNRERLTVFD